MPRPALPAKHFNPFLKKRNSPVGGNVPPVKYQILSCQGKEILVGRLKIEVPDGGHAFILRRFDTNALSITTMFRAAFPTSSEAEEKAEITWVKENHDLTGNNGSSREQALTRLAGTWVGPQLALELADSYGLTSLVQAMVDAKPDPNGNYRRSHKATAAANTPQPAANNNSADVADTPRAKVNANTPQKPPSKALPTPSPTSVPAAKRRKESSPAPAAAAAPVVVAAAVTAPSTPSQSKTLLPRRSARTKSPAPSRAPVALTSVASTGSSKPRSRSSVAPPSPKKKDLELHHQKSSPAKGDHDEDALVEDGVAGSELYEQDISEQKKLIADLKKKRAMAAAATASTSKQQDQDDEMDEEDEEEDEEEEEESEGPSKLKRARPDEEEPLKFQFKEPETEQRQIATNRRVGRFGMEPRTKSIAWGLAAFAVGMGAVSFLPNLF